MKKYDSLKVEMKTQLGNINSETVLIYVPILEKINDKALLKFLIFPNNIFKDNKLKTVPHHYSMTNNLFVGEAIQVFEKKPKQNAK